MTSLIIICFLFRFFVQNVKKQEKRGVMEHFPLHLTLLAYFCSFIGFMVYLFIRQRHIFVIAMSFAVIGFLGNTASLALRSMETGHGPYFNLHEIFLFSPWLLVITFLIVEFRYKIEDLGSLVMPVIVVLFSLAFFAPDIQEELPAFLMWPTLHRTLSFIGYAHFAILFCVSIMYLVQEDQLKRKQFGSLYQRLPSLELLDDVNHKSLIIGYAFFTSGFVTGSLSMAVVSGGSFFTWSLSSTLPLVITWVIFTTLFLSRIIFGYRRKPFAVWSLIASLAVSGALLIHIFR